MGSRSTLVIGSDPVAQIAPFRNFHESHTAPDHHVKNIDLLSCAIALYADEDKSTLGFAEFIQQQFGLAPLQMGQMPDLQTVHKFGWYRLDQQGQVVEVIERTIPGGFWFSWWVGGAQYATWTDWSSAFLLKAGAQGVAEFTTEDQPADLSYCALKGAIDFASMRQQTAETAGLVWDYAYHRGPQPLASDALYDFLCEHFGIAEEEHFASYYYIDAARLHYPRQRYITCLVNARIGDRSLICDGQIYDLNHFPGQPEQAELMQKEEAWYGYLNDLIDAASDDTLLTKMFFKC